LAEISIIWVVIGYNGWKVVRALRWGLRARGGIFDVYEAKVPATTEVDIIPGEFLPPCENNSDEFPVRSHPLLFVEANKAWSGGVDCMVSAHLHMLARVEL